MNFSMFSRFTVIGMACATWLSASDWPRFRGPNGTGISESRPLPNEIGPDRNLIWKVAVEKGNSSPIVVADRILLTGYEGDQRSTLCYRLSDGILLWRRFIEKVRDEPTNPINGPTTPSPASDGRSVFVFFPDYGLLAYDLEGNEQWRVPLGPFGHIQGMAVSPVYAEGRVLLLVDTHEQAYLAAFDSSSGRELWKVERPVGFLGSYATPVLFSPPGEPAQIVVAGAVELTGYSIQSGERLWWARGLTNSPAAPPLVAGPSVFLVEPVDMAAPSFKQMLSQFDKNQNGTIELAELDTEDVGQGIVHRLLKSVDRHLGNGDAIITEEEFNRAFNPDQPTGGLIKLNLSGKGDLSTRILDWRHTKGLPYVTGPLLYQDVLYLVRNGGIVSTFDPDTGRMLREERLKEALGDYYASPVGADGKIYFVSRDGKITILEAGPEWTVLSSGDLDEAVIATPAISAQRILIRAERHLYCFGL